MAWGEGKRQTGIPILVSKVALKKMTASLNLSFFLRKKTKTGAARSLERVKESSLCQARMIPTGDIGPGFAPVF